MTPEQWDRIRGLVERALDLPADRRAAMLEEVCSSDPSLRAEAEALLASDNNALSNFLESPLLTDGLRSSLEEITSPARVQAGQVFADRFQLIRKLGEGGMGQVWLAEQTAPVRRQVALKLVRAGMYDEAVLQRFEAERQSLAIMDHPSIAKVFDAGTTPLGQPFFVMEYVPGLPITEYCDQKKLKIRDRLELFIQACEGVQHAHQKAIIHRDLKPANILVVEVDGKPVPRIIDFGLAKATTPGEQSLFTQVGHLVGTPGYMSPEQADPNSRDIDTRTDVYSLGVVLYMLLTGARPFDTKADAKLPLDELLRRLREEEPPSPSDKVSSNTETSSATAEARSTDPRQLISQLRGDLDWITLKALEKDRERRYSAPSDLVADIQRYLNDGAVLAVPPSLQYRARKFARRYQAALATAGAFALVLVAAAVISVRQSIRASREAAVAEAVNDFLQNDLLAQAGASAQAVSNSTLDPDLKVRTALDRAAARVEGKFTRQPEVEASIRDTIGQTYQDLGLYPEARKQLERVLELRRQVLGMAEPKTLRTMSLLGYVAKEQGKYAEAEELESQAWAAQRRALGPEQPETLHSMKELASVYMDEGRLAQAEALQTQALEILRRVLGSDDPETLGSMSYLASVYVNEGKLPLAEGLYAEILAIRKRVLGPEHPKTLKAMSNLALVYDQEGRYPEAEALDTQTLEIRKRALGAEHLDTLTSLSNLASVYAHEDKFAQAEELYTHTLEIQKRVLGPESPDSADTVYSLGCVAARRGDKDRAIALLTESVDHGNPPGADLGMEEDSDLASLHGDPRFVALVAHAKQVADAMQKATASPTPK